MFPVILQITRKLLVKVFFKTRHFALLHCGLSPISVHLSSKFQNQQNWIIYPSAANTKNFSIRRDEKSLLITNTLSFSKWKINKFLTCLSATYIHSFIRRSSPSLHLSISPDDITTYQPPPQLPNPILFSSLLHDSNNFSQSIQFQIHHAFLTTN